MKNKIIYNISKLKKTIRNIIDLIVNNSWYSGLAIYFLIMIPTQRIFGKILVSIFSSGILLVLCSFYYPYNKKTKPLILLILLADFLYNISIFFSI
jgi:hypothetical protein